MPPRFFGTPQALRPCSRARGGALPVLAAGKPSRWVRAGRWAPLRVEQGRPHIAMAEEFLNGLDVVPVLERVGGK